MRRAPAPTPRRRGRGRRAASHGTRSVPALYGALTTGLVATVMVVASVASPATPPSIAELGPSAGDRIEEARDDQGIGSGDGPGGTCAPGDLGCVESGANDPTADPGSDSGIPPVLQVAAGRRCFGDPPLQTEDPHSPPCVFEIFKGDNGGATAPGVTATEIRVAVPLPSYSVDMYTAVAKALIAHFNRRYELYGRRLTPVFVPADPLDDPTANQAAAEDLLAEKPFAVVSGFGLATNAVIHRRLAGAGVLSIVSRGDAVSYGDGSPALDSDTVADGFTWLLDPPIDMRLRAGAGFVCRALAGRPASHAGPEYTDDPRRFAVVVLKERSGVSPDHRPLEAGLEGCDANSRVFTIAQDSSEDERRNLVLDLKLGRYTTLLWVGSVYPSVLLQWAERLGYFPEWVDFGAMMAHHEVTWTWPQWQGQARHAFGLTPHVRVRPQSEVPAMWALREGDPSLDANQANVEGRYETLLVLASGIQGAGPNLTPETFARALRATQFPNPNPGGPPHWQQGVGFGPGDPVFHDDYAIWWWNPSAPTQGEFPTKSGQGSFCYLDRGGRFTAEAFPANADSRLFSGSEPCR